MFGDKLLPAGDAERGAGASMFLFFLVTDTELVELLDSWGHCFRDKYPFPDMNLGTLFSPNLNLCSAFEDEGF